MEVEVVHGIYDDGPTNCGSCGGAMKKALSAPAIHFKGSGWAKKDAQSASRGKASPGATDAGEVAAASPGGVGSTAKSDSEASSGSSTPAPQAPEGKGVGGASRSPATKAAAGTASD
jgi:predicted nucleic acid-binding Zn ribbon protein